MGPGFESQQDHGLTNQNFQKLTKCIFCGLFRFLGSSKTLRILKCLVSNSGAATPKKICSPESIEEVQNQAVQQMNILILQRHQRKFINH
jgi:hypothetical protein